MRTVGKAKAVRFVRTLISQWLSGSTYNIVRGLVENFKLFGNNFLTQSRMIHKRKSIPSIFKYFLKDS